MTVFSTLLSDPRFAVLAIVAAVAGLVRGFSGFGSGMILAPSVAALFSPPAALVTLFVVESGPASLLIPNAVRQARWREVVPVAIGYLAGTPAGLWFLVHGDALTLRWAITLAILALLPVLWLGFSYRGPRNAPLSFAVGLLSGFMGNAAGLPGPPIIFYWMASHANAAVVRANLIAYFAITLAVTGAGMWLAGVFTWERVAMGLLACPASLIGLLAGMAMFDRASEQLYRRIAFMIVLAAAILSAPMLDGILRG